jgi:hypothetical protein
MKYAVGKEQAYADWKAKNDDPYGNACFVYAEHWAELLEQRISAAGAADWKSSAHGEQVMRDVIKEHAKEASREADKRPGMGITGFMYGMAVSILAQCWLYGEELRKWHNLATQLGDEGEKANATGGVLNPAIMTIGG